MLYNEVSFHVILPMMGFKEEPLLHDNVVSDFYGDQLEQAMKGTLREFLSQLPELAGEMYVALVYLRTNWGNEAWRARLNRG